MEILDLEELKENKSEVIDENLKGFMSKDEEVSKLLEDKIGEIDSETEKLNAKEEEIRDLEESSREKISMDASPDELIEIAGKIKSAQSELSEINANIEKWDDTKVYPRTIIMIDLNNLKYVNDNYGHEEGNNLIKKAGAILINTQLEKSEIIRTDGNEFLIYLIGYSKSQISTYISKLSKEFEKLPYNFGAAIGYSMIEDEIKTIDDAINEATIEMRKDKENYK